MTTLYVSDLDGTLLGSGGTLSAFTIESLNRLIEGGLCFTAATARGPHSAASRLKPLRLSQPALLMNGAMEYDLEHGAISHLITISAGEAGALTEAIRLHGVEPFLYAFDARGRERVHARGLVSPEQRAFVQVRLSEGDKRFNIGEGWSEALDERVFHIVCVGAREALEPLLPLASGVGLPCNLYEDVYTHGYLLEVGGRGATKRHGVLRMKARLGADKLVAFGDNLNDVDMMEAADYAVAVANAVDDVKAVADEVIAGCDEDGVAKWLLKHGE